MLYPDMPKISRNDERVKIKLFQKNIGSPNSPENNLIKYSKEEKVLTPVGNDISKSKKLQLS